MARLKRSSNILDVAQHRLAGLKSITPAPNYGTELTVAAYGTQIIDFSNQLNNNNQMVASLDELTNSLNAAEASLNQTNKRMLSATGAHYGADSSEYEQVGGTRLSERKRPVRKPKTPTS